MTMNQTPEHIHLPQPSFWPILLALGVVLIAIGIVSTVIISAIGALLTLASIIGWTLENRATAQAEEAHHG